MQGSRRKEVPNGRANLEKLLTSLLFFQEACQKCRQVTQMPGDLPNQDVAPNLNQRYYIRVSKLSEVPVKGLF